MGIGVVGITVGAGDVIGIAVGDEDGVKEGTIVVDTDVGELLGADTGEG